MKSKVWRLRGIGILFVGGVLAAVVWADEKIEMSTYIPAPSVSTTSFDRTHAKRMTIGETAPLNFSLTNPAEPNPLDGTLLVSQKVGIGTANPGNPLEVAGIIEANHSLDRPDLQVQMGTIAPYGAPTIGFLADIRGAGVNSLSNSGEGGARGAAISLHNQTGKLFFSGNRASAAQGATFDPFDAVNSMMVMETSTGNVGIGTSTPRERLDVSGRMIIEGDYGNIYTTAPAPHNATGVLLKATSSKPFVVAEIGTATAGSAFSVYNGSTHVLYVRGDSKVGIGTTTPAYPLDVRTTNNTALYANTSAANFYAASFQGVTHGTSSRASAYGLIGYATSAGGIALYGSNTGSGAYGGTGWGSLGVHGYSPNNWAGYFIGGLYGVYGQGSTYGVFGRASAYWGVPVYAQNTGSGYFSLLSYGNYGLYTNGVVAASSYTYVSDARMKKEIAPIPNALEKITALRGVRFRWDNSGPHDDRLHLGVVGQEVEKVFPEVVGTAPDGMKTVDYGALTPALIEAVKEQQRQIHSLQSEVDELRKQLRESRAARKTSLEVSR